jgi:hypothetical protein
VIAIMWMLTKALDGEPGRARPWIAGTVSAVVAAILINTTIAVYLGAALCLLTIWFFVRGQSRRAVICFGCAAIAGLVFAGILALNYVTAGLASDQQLQFFMPLANIEKLYRWGALALAILTYEGAKAMALYSAPFLSFTFFWQVLHFLRAYILFLLFAGGFVMAALVFAMRSADERRRAFQGFGIPIAVLSAGMVAFGLFAVAGRTQYISFFRYSSFIMPVLIVIGTAIWGFPWTNW